MDKGSSHHISESTRCPQQKPVFEVPKTELNTLSTEQQQQQQQQQQPLFVWIEHV